MLKITFLVHGIVAVVLGVLLLGVPGRFLPVLGWAPVDPIMARLLGAAFLGLAWGDFRGWRALSWSEVNVFVEVQLAFAALASVGLLRHLLSSGGWPAMIWILFGVFVLFAVAWLVALLSGRQQPVPA
jgi:hypothetical protein